MIFFLLLEDISAALNQSFASLKDYKGILSSSSSLRIAGTF